MFGLKHFVLQCAWFSNLLLFFLLSSMDMKVNLFKLHFLSIYFSTPKANTMRGKLRIFSQLTLNC